MWKSRDLKSGILTGLQCILTHVASWECPVFMRGPFHQIMQRSGFFTKFMRGAFSHSLH